MKDNLYNGAVEDWLGNLILPILGVDYSPELFDFYQLSDDKGYFTGKESKVVIEVERRKISTYFGYSVTLNSIVRTRKIFTVHKEIIEGEESLRAEIFTGAQTNVLDIFKKNFKGLLSWPR